MNKLLQISIGPIQEFIASARRTRDLWYGSELLSEISKKVASSVQEQGGTLIFPSDIKESDSIANIILAEIPGDKNTQQIYETAKQKAKDKWKDVADKAFNKVKDDVNKELWDKQVEDAIEFYAASVPINDNNYEVARKRLMKIFAGRKALRDFNQSFGNNNPKSSLDGRRESVLNEKHNINGVIKGEYLCAIGLIKRIQGAQEKYPSVARVTADYWIRQVKDSQEFKDFVQKCEQYKLSKINENICSKKYYKDFAFDGSLLFKDRYSQLISESIITQEQSEDLKKSLNKITEKYGEIYPYFVILKADGDRMGKAISSMSKQDDHRNFSNRLSKFSKGVKNIVENNNGVCVYAGGDDVFAFLPIDNALKCARKLRQSFIDIVNIKEATLSVGISIGHFMEPLEDLRNFADKAEILAKSNDDEKQAKDGLAIIINPRSGGDFDIREKWKDETDESSLDNKIISFAKLFNDKKLPSKLPYDLRTLAQSLEYRNIEDEKIIQAEIKVLLKRKQQNVDSIKAIIKPRIEKIKTFKDLCTFAKEMLVAQWFAMGTQIKEVNN